MKKSFLSFFLICFLNNGLLAQIAPSGQTSPSQGVTPSTITRPPMAPPLPKIGTTPVEDKNKKVETKPKPAEYSFVPSFTEPGILSLSNRGFIGVDHLYNVPADIPVVVELVKTESLILLLTKEKIEQFVQTIFQKEGINTSIKPTAGPTLPFFHLLVMVIPTPEGVSAFCGGRFFEKVDVDRVTLPSGVFFQAITWEYQNLIFSPKEQSDKQITDAINDIVNQFLSRYKYYKNIKPT